MITLPAIQSRVVCSLAAALLFVAATASGSDSFNPGPLSLMVVGADPTAQHDNHYVVQIPAKVGKKITVKITGIGNTPSVTEAEKYKRGDELVLPETDGEPMYTFAHTAGAQTAPGAATLAWGIDSKTAPGEYKFRLIRLEQRYKPAPAGWTGGVSAKTNDQASELIIIRAVAAEAGK